MRKNSGRVGFIKLYRKDMWWKYDFMFRLYKISVCIKIVDYMVCVMEIKVVVFIFCFLKINDKDIILNLFSFFLLVVFGVFVLLMFLWFNISDVVEVRLGKILDLFENVL